MLGMRQKRRLVVDDPPVDSVFRSSGAEMRMPAPIFDATEEQRGAVGKPRRTRIEDTVDRIGPVRGRQNGIGFMPMKKRFVAALHEGRPSFVSTDPSASRRSAKRISQSAKRKESVDSAPWFSFTRSTWSPSRQPPVV